MSVNLKTNSRIDRYIAQVIKEADDHAPNVFKIVQPLSDAVRGRLNLGVDTVEAYQRMGRIGRSCWVTLAGNKYAFSYNHDSERIEMREHSLQGQVLANFHNGTTAAQIARAVRRM